MDNFNFDNEEWLRRIAALLQKLLDQSTVESYYTVEEIAVMLKLSAYRVRQLCNQGRIRADKSMTRSGPCSRWVISNTEYERIRREGFLPPRSKQVKTS